VIGALTFLTATIGINIVANFVSAASTFPISRPAASAGAPVA
jgi:cytosine/uracil/thiamine/allantoin permease